MEKKTYTVSEINSYINKKLKMDSNLKNILIQGEISNYKTYPSGHSYFTLKDENSQISAIMYKNNKDRFLKFTPKDGDKVIIKGSVEVYEKNGKYQLYATRITEDGVGNLHVAFEQLKRNLNKKGLFKDSHKKAIPKYPKKIGVVTAQNGAAVRDIITTIKRRYPVCEILIFSTLVQGDQAASQIVKQIENAEKFELDTLIVGRGGGSIEDLWPFNEEKVAYAIYNCRIPVISAVGHEIDYTIADFVADKRAPTPTAAAELAVPELDKVKENVNLLKQRLNKKMEDKIKYNKTKLDHIFQKNIFKNPDSIYNIKGMHMDSLINRLNFASKTIVTKNQHKLIQLERSPIFKNPESIYNTKGIQIDSLINRLNFASKTIVEKNKNKLMQIEKSSILKNPESMYKLKEMQLESLVNKLNFTANNIITENRNKLFKLENSHILKNPNEITKNKRNACLKNINKLEVLNPLLTLKRGYSIAKTDENIISSVNDVKAGDKVDIELKDGTINTKVI